MLHLNVPQMDAAVGVAGIQFTPQGGKGGLIQRYIEVVIGVSQLTKGDQRQLRACHVPDRIPILGFAENDARFKGQEAGVGMKCIQLASEFAQLSLQFFGQTKDIQAFHNTSIAKRKRLYKGKS